MAVELDFEDPFAGPPAATGLDFEDPFAEPVAPEQPSYASRLGTQAGLTAEAGVRGLEFGVAQTAAQPAAAITGQADLAANVAGMASPVGLVRALGAATQGDGSFLDRVQAGAGALMDMLKGSTITEAAQGVAPGAFDVGVPGAAGYAAETQEQLADIQARTAENKAAGGGGLGLDVAAGLTQLAPAVATGLVTRSPRAAAATVAAPIYGQALAEGQEEGLTPSQAAGRAAFMTGAEFVTELPVAKLLTLPASAILREAGTSGLKQALGKIAKTAGAEGLQEAQTSLISDAYDSGALDENKTIGEALADAGYAGLVGALTGGIAGAPAAAIEARQSGQATATADKARSDYLASVREVDDGEGGVTYVDAAGNAVGDTLDEVQATAARLTPAEMQAAMAAAPPAPKPGEPDLGLSRPTVQPAPNVSELPLGYFEAQQQAPLGGLERPGAATQTPGAGTIDEAELTGAGIDTAQLGEVAPPATIVRQGERTIGEQELQDAAAREPALPPLERPQPPQQRRPDITDEELARAGITEDVGPVVAPTPEPKAAAPKMQGVPRPTNIQEKSFDIVGDPKEIRRLYDVQGGFRVKNGLRFPTKLLAEFQQKADEISAAPPVSTEQLGEVAPLEPTDGIPRAPDADNAGRLGRTERLPDASVGATDSRPVGGGTDIGRVSDVGDGRGGDAGSVGPSPAPAAPVAAPSQPDVALAQSAAPAATAPQPAAVEQQETPDDVRNQERQEDGQQGREFARSEDVRQGQAQAEGQRQEVGPSGTAAPRKQGAARLADLLRQANKLDAKPEQYEDARLTGLEGEAIERLAALFNKNVVVFRAKAGAPWKAGGALFPSDPSTLFINADSGAPATYVFMHEMTHSMKRTDPETWAKLEAAMRPLLKNRDRYQKGRLGGKALPEAIVTEEMIADMMAENASNPQFWSDLYGRFGDKSAWAQFVSYMRSFLERAIDTLYTIGPSNYVSDLNKAYEALVDAAYNHARAQHGDVASNGKAMELPAYHGTPHEFDEFSLSKIGTGEGAQAYGWGLYFAENEGVAKGYQNALSSKTRKLLDKNGKEVDDLQWPPSMKSFAVTILKNNDGDYALAAKDVEKWSPDAVAKEQLAALQELKDEGYTVRSTGGALYTVDIPDSAVAKMLDWDKPLGEQSEAIRSAVASKLQPEVDRRNQQRERLNASSPGRLTHPVIGKLANKVTTADILRGEDAYTELVRQLGSKKAASEYLAAAGIPGIRYLDAGSRNKPLKQIKKEFLEELPEDAQIDEVAELIGTGTFSPKNEALLSALVENDWLGFDYPAQAISAALGKDIQNFEVTPSLLRAVADAQEDGTRNLVVFDDKLVRITHKNGRPVTKSEREAFIDEMTPQDGPALEMAAGTLSSAQGSPPSQSLLDEGNAYWRAGANMWDNLNRVRILQDKAVQRGLQMRDNMNVWVRENLSRSKMRVMADKVTEDYQQPILDLMATNDLSLKQVDDYLYALHAPERNAAIAAINPRFPDGGSGMTNAEAASILAAFTPEQTTVLKQIEAKIKALQDYKLSVMEKYGLMEPADVARLRSMYSNYVPLKTIEESDTAPGNTGRGLEIRGSEVKQALGRGSRATSPLLVSFQDMARTLVRAHKNEAGNALLELSRDPVIAGMQQNGKPIIAIADPADFARPVTDAQGQVSVGIPGNWWQNEEVFVTKENGVPRYIHVRDPELMAQLRRMGDAELGAALRAIGQGTRLFARMLTQYNPVFAPVNIIRDAIQASVLALGVKGVNPLKVLAAVPANLGRIMANKVRPNQRYKEFLEDGASTNAYGLNDLQDSIADIEALGISLGYTRPANNAWDKAWNAINAKRKSVARKRSVRTVFDGLSWWNEAFENAVRLSTYNAMRDAGYTREEAAFQSKELSTNFNKKGQLSAALNSAYVFVNAAMQGNRALVKFWKESPKIRAAFIGLVAAGVLQDVLGSLFGGEDDESGLANLDEVGDWALDHNIVIPTGDNEQVKIPIPYGLNLPFVMGRRVSRAIRTGEGMSQIAGILNVALDNFSPIGGFEPVSERDGSTNVSGTIAKTVSPSLLRPMVGVAFNANFMGAPIAKEPFQGDPSPAPRAYDFKPGTADYAVKLAEWLNSASGGNKAKPGDINVSPEHIQYLIGEYSGGAGRFVSDVTDISSKLARGAEGDIDWAKAPFVRSFTGADSRSDAYARYREIRQGVNYLKDEKEARLPLDPAYVGVRRLVERTEDRLSDLRKRRKAAYAREDMAMVRQIQEQETTLIKAVVKQFNAQQKAPAN